jgi:hypothetical protein
MNGERQMLPVHTTRIRASLLMAKIPSAHARDLGDGGSGHGVDRSLCRYGARRMTAIDGTRQGFR